MHHDAPIAKLVSLPQPLDPLHVPEAHEPSVPGPASTVPGGVAYMTGVVAAARALEAGLSIWTDLPQKSTLSWPRWPVRGLFLLAGLMASLRWLSEYACNSFS